jgi:hypothetical protein
MDENGELEIAYQIYVRGQVFDLLFDIGIRMREYNISASIIVQLRSVDEFEGILTELLEKYGTLRCAEFTYSLVSFVEQNQSWDRRRLENIVVRLMNLTELMRKGRSLTRALHLLITE